MLPRQNCSLLFLFILVLPSINFLPSLCLNDIRYTNCSEAFTCGTIQNIRYPFWGVNRADYCGLPGFELDCEDQVPTITMASEKYRILDISPQNRSITLAREDLWNNICPARFLNTTLNYDLFRYSPGLTNLTLFYGCDFSTGPLCRYNCSINGTDVDGFYMPSSDTLDPSMGSCNSSILVPVFVTVAGALQANLTSLSAAINQGFNLFWSPGDDQCFTCMESGGVCGHNCCQSEFICFCYDKPNSDSCPTRPGMSSSFSLMIASTGLIKLLSMPSIANYLVYCDEYLDISNFLCRRRIRNLYS
ncbi:hypothetical protein NMG60_11006163 [Bertholletia excelsa]